VSIRTGLGRLDAGKEWSVRRWTGPVSALLCVVLLAVPALASAADLPQRQLNEQVLRNAKGWLVFKGDVDPGWNDKSLRVYKRTCKSCTWRVYQKVRTDAQGRWRTRIYAPRTGYWYWKAVVPAAGNYARSVTRIWRTFVQ
jgi:hypothetical protein